MRPSRIFAVLLLVATTCGLAWAIVDRANSIAEIDKAIGVMRADLKSAEDDLAKYEPSLVQALVAIRVETMKLSISMLEQKRGSFLHRIDLRYTIDGKAFTAES